MKKDIYDKSIKFNLPEEDYKNFKALSKSTGILASEAMRRLVKIYLKEAEGKTPAQAVQIITP